MFAPRLFSLSVFVVLALVSPTRSHADGIHDLLGKRFADPAVVRFRTAHRLFVFPEAIKKLQSGGYESAYSRGDTHRLDFEFGVVKAIAIGYQDYNEEQHKRTFLQHRFPLAYGLRQGMPKEAVLALTDPSIVKKDEVTGAIFLTHSPELHYTTVFHYEVKTGLLTEIKIEMTGAGLEPFREQSRVAHRVDRIKSPMFDVLHRQCDDPLLLAFLARFAFVLNPERCSGMKNILRADQLEWVREKAFVLTFTRGLLDDVRIEGKSSPVELPLGLQLGVTTTKQIEALRTHPAVASVTFTNGVWRLALHDGNPFQVSLVMDRTTEKLSEVMVQYNRTAAEIADEAAKTKAEREAFDRLLAKVREDLSKPSPVVAAPVAEANRAAEPTGDPRAAANVANAPTLRRLAELKSTLENLLFQHQLAKNDRDVAKGDRSFKQFEGSYNRRDPVSGRSLGATSSYSSRQGGAALIAEGNASRRMAALEAEINGVVAEMKRLQGQLK